MAGASGSVRLLHMTSLPHYAAIMVEHGAFQLRTSRGVGRKHIHLQEISRTV